MNRFRFQDFRVRVAAHVQSVGSNLGVCVNNIPALAGLVNSATERLLYDPLQPDDGWWGTWIKTVFNMTQSDPYITAPRGVARLMLMNVCKQPVKIQNGFYEFLDYGIGLQPNACTTAVSSCPGECGELLQSYDRDSTPILGTFAATPQILRVFISDSRDVGKTIIFSGTDSTGDQITATDPASNQQVNGEYVTFALPFKDTVGEFASVTAIQKDITYGYVTVMQVDPVTGTSSNLTTMEPSETTASYRRYLVNGLPGNCCSTDPIQVTALCKLDYAPVASDPDYLIIPNVPALISECEAIRYESMDNQKAAGLATLKHQIALRALFGQLDHMLGKQRPAINVPLFGSDKLKPQPV